MIPPDFSADDGRLGIILGYGRAFGSGRHETTESCVKAIEDLASINGSRALDLGTGTGILALAAVLMGASSCVALDIEKEAVEAAARNAGLNDLGNRIWAVCGDLGCVRDRGVFDLILANLYGDILINLTGGLSVLLREGGTMVLSGIDYADSTQLKVKLTEKGLLSEKVEFLDDYVTQVWSKPHV